LSAVVRRRDAPLRRGAARTAADRYVERYASVGLARALVAHSLLGLDSMRTLKQRLDHTPGLGRRLGLRGALSPLKPVGYTSAAEHTFLAAIAVYLFALLSAG
jgi:hypothetical protein